MISPTAAAGRDLQLAAQDLVVGRPAQIGQLGGPGPRTPAARSPRIMANGQPLRHKIHPRLPSAITEFPSYPGGGDLTPVGAGGDAVFPGGKAPGHSCKQRVSGSEAARCSHRLSAEDPA